MRRSALAAAAAAWLLCAGAASAQPSPSYQPAAWDAHVALVELADENPDPGVVEVRISAQLADVEVAPDMVVRAWTYNGTLPGPLIRVRRGQRLIVHFTNELDEPTTIHWHGVRVPIEMDGVPGISQPAVERGESFTYDFIAHDAGLYWYHPHVMSAAQVGYGLYGPLLVEDPDEDVGVADELTLVLSDISFDRQGRLEPAGSGGSVGMVFGREGTFVLVNGRRTPTLRARAGAPQRWRIVNAAKSRFFLLHMDGQPFTIIGGDGGLQEHATTGAMVLVASGERVDLIVTPDGEPGGALVVHSLLYNRGYGSVEFRAVETLFTIAFTDEPVLPPPSLPEVTRSFDLPSPAADSRLDLVFTLAPGERGHSEFRVNGVPHWRATPYRAALGDTQIWALTNETEWDHPFHLHGFFFLVLDDNDEPLRPLVWKDTVNVPRGRTVRILVTFDERPGTWMFHCHILDHADGGLMGTVHVGPGEPVPFTHGGGPDAAHTHH